MMRVLFIHAGPPKTGSTAIQIFFRDNAEALARNGVYWPQAGTELRGYCHLDLVQAFNSPPETSTALQSLARELNENGRPGRVLISAEQFAKRLVRPQYLAAVEDYFHDLGYGIHVIAYVRPQPALINSLFAQHVKFWRLMPTIEEFMLQEVQSGRLDYMKLFAALRASKSARLTLRPFNRGLREHGIVADICGVLGLSPQEPAGTFTPDRVNVLPGPKTLNAFRRLRLRGTTEIPHIDWERMQALTWPIISSAGALGWNNRKYRGIAPSGHAIIESLFYESNDQLAQLTWGKSWREVFDGEVDPPPLEVFHLPDAPPAERREFKDFLEQSMDVIRELASPA